jgi:hypothetical protein
MRQFDLHEFLGYIAPGMLLLVGVRCIWPEAEKVLPLSGISFGEFGVGVVLAYVAGQLLQTIGNGIEKVWWWMWGGMPTDWLRTGKRELVASTQAARIESKVGRMLGSNSFKLADVNAKQWYSVTRQVCAAVAAAGRGVRIDVFNSYYGLCRGVAASLVVLVVWNLLTNLLAWKVHVALAVLLVLTVHRMHRYAVHYGREVFIQFLQLPESPDREGQ